MAGGLQCSAFAQAPKVGTNLAGASIEVSDGIVYKVFRSLQSSGPWLEVKAWAWALVDVVFVKSGDWDNKVDEFVNEVNTGEDFDNIGDEVRGYTEADDLVLSIGQARVSFSGKPFRPIYLSISFSHKFVKHSFSLVV